MLLRILRVQERQHKCQPADCSGKATFCRKLCPARVMTDLGAVLRSLGGHHDTRSVGWLYWKRMALERRDIPCTAAARSTRFLLYLIIIKSSVIIIKGRFLLYLPRASQPCITKGARQSTHQGSVQGEMHRFRAREMPLPEPAASPSRGMRSSSRPSTYASSIAMQPPCPRLRSGKQRVRSNAINESSTRYVAGGRLVNAGESLTWASSGARRRRADRRAPRPT